MSDEKIEVGSAVVLKAGTSSVMTVIAIDGKWANCAWHDKTGKNQVERYPVGALRLHEIAI